MNRMLTCDFVHLLFVCAIGNRNTTHTQQFIESSCGMKLTFPLLDSNDSIKVEDIARMESSMTTYFYQLFIATNSDTGTGSRHDPMYNIPIFATDSTNNQNSKNDDSNNNNKNHVVQQPLQFHVDIVDSILIGNMATISARVSFLYEAPSASMVLESQQLAETFTLVHLNDDTETTALKVSVFQTFTSNPDAVIVVFESNEDDNNTSSIVLKDDYQNSAGSYTSTEVALIVVTVFLSIVLLIVSSVLLHITGGWKVCTNAMSNCLFEEIDEDDEDDPRGYYNQNTNKTSVHQQYIGAQPTRTYPLQQSQDQGDEHEVNGANTNDQDDDEEDTNFMDVESTMTSVLPTSASGLLGVSRNRDAVHTMLDDEDDEESNIYGDGMTPVSRSNNEPLGITSMRKLPLPTENNINQNNETNTKGGFSSGIMMIQNRLLLRSASKKDSSATTPK